MSAQGNADTVPMCDTCSGPVLWHENWGWCHVGVTYLVGKPNPLGHEATAKGWSTS